MKYYTFLCFLLFIISCTEKHQKLPYYNTPDFTPIWEISKEKIFHQIRPFKLLNQENNIFSEKDIEGKICVADFFFDLSALLFRHETRHRHLDLRTMFLRLKVAKLDRLLDCGLKETETL
jgi:protein SCO1/2